VSDSVLIGLVAVLVLLDGGFAGYRARAGRYALIRRLPHDLRAVRRGCWVAVATLLLAAACWLALGVARFGPSGLEFDPAAREAALRILRVAGAYTALVVLAFVPYLTGSPDLRSLTTVVLFGPFTLLRPFVVIGASILAAWGQPRDVVLALALGGALTFLQDPLLERLGRAGARV
jgi:hypothetical protein